MYDIETGCTGGARRLQKMAKLCEAYGTRVQRSVFQMTLDLRMLDSLRDRIRSLINPEKDRVMIYPLSESAAERAECIGSGKVIHRNETLIL